MWEGGVSHLAALVSSPFEAWPRDMYLFSGARDPGESVVASVSKTC